MFFSVWSKAEGFKQIYLIMLDNNLYVNRLSKKQKKKRKQQKQMAEDLAEEVESLNLNG